MAKALSWRQKLVTMAEKRIPKILQLDSREENTIHFNQASQIRDSMPSSGYQELWDNQKIIKSDIKEILNGSLQK